MHTSHSWAPNHASLMMDENGDPIRPSLALRPRTADSINGTASTASMAEDEVASLNNSITSSDTAHSSISQPVSPVAPNQSLYPVTYASHQEATSSGTALQPNHYYSADQSTMFTTVPPPPMPFFQRDKCGPMSPRMPEQVDGVRISGSDEQMCSLGSHVQIQTSQQQQHQEQQQLRHSLLQQQPTYGYDHMMNSFAPPSRPLSSVGTSNSTQTGQAHCAGLMANYYAASNTTTSFGQSGSSNAFAPGPTMAAIHTSHLTSAGWQH